MIFIVHTTRLKFDDEEERARIQAAFGSKKREETRLALLAVLDSFVAGDFARCYALVRSQPRAWLEYLNPTIYDVMRSVHEQALMQAAGEAHGASSGLPIEEPAYPRFAIQVGRENPIPTTIPDLARLRQGQPEPDVAAGD